MRTMLIRFAAGRRFAIAGFASFGGTVNNCRFAVALPYAICLLVTLCCDLSLRAQTMAGKTHVYYVAADEVNWDYAPTGRDEAMGHQFDALQKGFTESGPHQIGRVYKKAIYREYSDDTFTVLKQRTAEDAYLGLLGPVLRAEVGDTIKVIFKNNATHPFSMHPHGVLYKKDSEGADYNDETSGWTKAMAPCLPAGRTLIFGRYRSVRDQGRTIPVRSSGCITRMRTKYGTLRQACLA